jgi:hypothetical protein
VREVWLLALSKALRKKFCIFLKKKKAKNMEKKNSNFFCHKMPTT